MSFRQELFAFGALIVCFMLGLLICAALDTFGIWWPVSSAVVLFTYAAAYKIGHVDGRNSAKNEDV